MSEEKKSQIVVNGISKFESDMKAHSIQCDGILKAKKSVIAQEVKSNGIILVKEDLKVEHLENTGILRVKGNIVCDTLTSMGLMKVTNITGEDVKVTGGIKSKLVEAEHFLLELDTKCHVEEIEASQVNIRQLHKKKKKCIVNNISADQISLEHVVANKVTGDQIEIGRGCRIEVVEYKSNLTIDPSSKVTHKIKL